ncbi:hypothetical protein BS50DRAFT_231039 [Corynespora cassiicola Philippines]|uniref:RING-type domain-containing protein n=1 Tax=Corynespora cassiicola Philippines TaxID=1448308 RepID=A0A2T2N218_CORCC|nr:hypothetical protein BS50DRAFT_231039 [Corynespora cassiicola Philippines]
MTANRGASQPDSPYPTFFDDAFRISPSPGPEPPQTTFLDTILNPDTTSTSTSTTSTTRRRRRHIPSPIPYLDSPDADADANDNHDNDNHDNPDDMPPARPRNARLPNGYVDLTSDPPSNARRKRPSPTPGPSSKRLKRPDGSAAATKARTTPPADIDAIDLSDEKGPVHHVLQKQREEAVKAQQRPDDKATTFNTFTCVICMDTPKDITATSCGHLFCHTCLMEALIAGENRSGPNEPKRSQCPVCRKFINRNKASDIIPLLMKKGLSTQPRRKPTPTPNKVS